MGVPAGLAVRAGAAGGRVDRAGPEGPAGKVRSVSARAATIRAARDAASDAARNAATVRAATIRAATIRAARDADDAASASGRTRVGNAARHPGVRRTASGGSRATNGPPAVLPAAPATTDRAGGLRRGRTAGTGVATGRGRPDHDLAQGRTMSVRAARGPGGRSSVGQDRSRSRPMRPIRGRPRAGRDRSIALVRVPPLVGRGRTGRRWIAGPGRASGPPTGHAPVIGPGDPGRECRAMRPDRETARGGRQTCGPHTGVRTRLERRGRRSGRPLVAGSSPPRPPRPACSARVRS